MKILPKVKPLLISFSFAFLGILVGQKLLSYENENILISHCRQSNLQKIFSYNNLDGLPYEDRPKVLDLINIKDYCLKYVSKETKDELKLLEQYPLKEYDVLYEVVGYKIRLYADSFNRLENTRSNIQGKLLIGLLGFNVASLATMAIFLKADSEDIEEKEKEKV